MKEDKEIEKILLNDKNYEKLMRSKIQKEFESGISEHRNCVKEITDIKNVPPEELFSQKTIYIVINKNSKTKSYINGVQAEGFLGSDNLNREKLLSKETDFFVEGGRYIKFFKFNV